MKLHARRLISWPGWCLVDSDSNDSLVAQNMDELDAKDLAHRFNTHGALVEALREIDRLDTFKGEDMPHVVDGDDPEEVGFAWAHYSCGKIARAALAAAEAGDESPTPEAKR